MYCPNCAAEAPKDQKYCRRCGQDLNMVVQVLRGQQVVEAWNRSTALWGLTLCITGVTAGCILKILTKGGIGAGAPLLTILMAIAVAVTFLGIGLTAYAFLPAARPRRLSRPDAIPIKNGNTQPDLLPATPAAVTDHTTELFEENVERGSVHRL